MSDVVGNLAGGGRGGAEKRPLIIAHRGASGLRPEHTLAAYELAIEQGADFIEPDLVITKDGVLVARHENEISGTTDVADRPRFAERKRAKTIDGAKVEGWFAEDFTLAELKTLRCRERLPRLRPGNTAYDGKFEIPTLDEVIALVKKKAAGRAVGIYPETKHPSYFRALGLPLEEPLAKTLRAAGWDGPDAPVFVQSFEVGNLKTLKKLVGVRLVQLVMASGGPFDGAEKGAKYAEMLTARGLAEVATYAAGLGPEKALIVPRDRAGASGPPTALAADARRAGLAVHPWTFRSENAFLPSELKRGGTGEDAPRRKGDYAAEYRLFAARGVDGVFSDFPGDAAEALAR